MVSWQKQLQVLGFNSALHEEVNNFIKAGRDAFTVKDERKINNDHTLALLHFVRAGDQYQFKHFYQAVHSPNTPDPLRHKFPVHDAQRLFTIDEAYHLTCGRALFRPVPGIWLQFPHAWRDELREFPWMNLRTLLIERSVADMQQPAKAAQLISDLQDGKRAAVTLQHGEHQFKGHVEVAPQFKSFKYYNEEGRLTNYLQIHQRLHLPPPDPPALREKYHKQLRKSL